MSRVSIPIEEWFVGDVFSKKGNCYVGSVGATSISSNAFCYRVWLERTDEGPKLKGETYDVLTASDPDQHQFVAFDWDESGWLQMCGWLDRAYEAYLQEKRTELVVAF